MATQYGAIFGYGIFSGPGGTNVRGIEPPEIIDTPGLYLWPAADEPVEGVEDTGATVYASFTPYTQSGTDGGTFEIRRLS